MAVEKGKVLPVLQEKLKGKGYTKTFIEKMATKFAEKIEDEDGITEYIEDRLDIFNEADADGDRRATLAVEKEKAKKPAQETTEDEPEDIPADTPAWAKALIAQNKKLEEKVNSFEQQKTAESIEQRFRNDERVKNLPPMAFKGRIPKTEEEFETFATELADDWKDYKVTERFGNDTPPGTNPKNPTGKKEASKEDIDRIAEKINV